VEDARRNDFASFRGGQRPHGKRREVGAAHLGIVTAVFKLAQRVGQIMVLIGGDPILRRSGRISRNIQIAAKSDTSNVAKAVEYQ
jgi:hypothetical protein